MIFKKSIILLFLILFLNIISISFSKSSKDKNKDELEIVSISTNDQLPLYYEITINGYFEKNGINVNYLGNKIHDFVYKQGEQEIVKDNTGGGGVDLLIADLKNESKDEPKPDTTPIAESTPTPTSTPIPKSETPTPTSTPTPKSQVTPTPIPSNNIGSDESRNESSYSKPSTPTPKPTKSSKPTKTPKPTKIPKPTTTPRPTSTPIVTPTPLPIIIKNYDTISFNLTNIELVSSGLIEISYKNGLKSNIKFEPVSIIKTMFKIENIGGIVELDGSFFYTDKYEPSVSIGNKTCELLTSNKTSIRCYLSYGFGCGHLIEIDNLSFGSSTNISSSLTSIPLAVPTYCYSNPIIENVFGYKDKKDSFITIFGKNFLPSAKVTIEKPNGHKRDCTKLIYTTNTFFLCQLGESYNKNSTTINNNSTSPSSSPLSTSNNTILTFNNFPIDSSSSNINSLFQIKISKVKLGDDENEIEITSSNGGTDKKVIDDQNTNKNNNNNNNDKNDSKLYLLIIIPSVLFIIIVALVAIFIKTRVTQQKKSKDMNNSNIPFQMLDDMNT